MFLKVTSFLFDCLLKDIERTVVINRNEEL